MSSKRIPKVGEVALNRSRLATPETLWGAGARERFHDDPRAIAAVLAGQGNRTMRRNAKKGRK